MVPGTGPGIKTWLVRGLNALSLGTNLWEFGCNGTGIVWYDNCGTSVCWLSNQ